MTKPPFPGFPAFLEMAAVEIGRPEAAAPARRITTLAALANLCGQASQSDDAHVPSILAKAAEFRDQLHAAYRAAELMLADLRDRRGVSPVEPQGRSNSSTAQSRRARSSDPASDPTP